MKARAIALAGMITSLQILTLALAYIIPTINLALLFAAALYPGILLRIGFNKKAAFTSFITSAALIIFLIQIPEIQVAFISFFGWYGFLHESTKKIKKIKQQIIRWLCFLLSAVLMYIAVTYFVSIQINYALWIIILAGLVAFTAMQFLYEFTVKGIVKKGKIKFIDGKITFK